ncbi:MAG TPA: hypothetical protein EYQ41_12175 [Micavibrio sp.]|nr:hypothetical protein [Micavibrio sp.]
MEIKLFVKDGHVAFQCEGVFVRAIQKVILEKETGLFWIRMDDDSEQELDCPICPETIEAIGDYGFCGMGFYHHGQMMGASVFPLEKR